MIVRYDFDDWGFDYELSKSQLIQFLVDEIFEESNIRCTGNSWEIAEWIVDEFCLYENIDYYEDEIKDYYEDEARSEWERCVQLENDEKDWYGTKKDVIGV